MASLSLFNPLVFLALLLKFGYSLETNVTNAWDSAVATWYGDPFGAGSVGGACGYLEDVKKAPYYSMVSAGNNFLFKKGEGCGSCFMVSCGQPASCSGRPITVTISDECPGSCNNDGVHFDLSGTAFGALAKPGQESSLRSAGRIQVNYVKVPCNYHSIPLTFHVDKGSNKNYFACTVEYENGDGDISFMELKPSNSANWIPMQQSWGATWKADLPTGTTAPFSLRLTTLTTRRSLVASNVIPLNWAPGQYYKSNTNF